MKAQLKMFETVGVLIVFFFLLITGSVIYFGAQKASLQKERVKSSEQYAFQIVLKALHLPELDCSFLVTQRDNCIDIIKLNTLSDMLTSNPENYFTEFGYATITVNQVYPQEETISLYSLIPEDENNNPIYASKITTQNPILLYDAWANQYAFGVIEVSVYVD